MKNKIVISILTVLSAFLIFGLWYNYQYSMDKAPSFEVNDTAENPRLLIATQGSQYKNFITEGIVEKLKPTKMYIKVIDVSKLKTTNSAEWDCIFIAHTWEINTPPNAVAKFIKNTNAKDKIITLATSGEGTYHIEGVDAITSASIIEEAQYDVDLVLEKINKILGSRGFADAEK